MAVSWENEIRPDGPSAFNSSNSAAARSREAFEMRRLSMRVSGTRSPATVTWTSTLPLTAVAARSRSRNSSPQANELLPTDGRLLKLPQDSLRRQTAPRSDAHPTWRVLLELLTGGMSESVERVGVKARQSEGNVGMQCESQTRSSHRGPALCGPSRREAVRRSGRR